MRETIGTDVSRALTEVRTVHSRAKTALTDRGLKWSNDPDKAEMIADLQTVVDLLDKYKKTGKTKSHSYR